MVHAKQAQQPAPAPASDDAAALKKQQPLPAAAPGRHVPPPLLSPKGLALLAVQAFFALLAPALALGVWAVKRGVRLANALCDHPVTAPVARPVLDAAADFVTYHRGVFVTAFIMPASRAWDLVEMLRDWMYELQMPAVGDTAMRRQIHAARVAEVQRQVKDLVARGATRLCTARPGFLAMSMKAGTYKQTWAGVDVHSLRDVIYIDEEREVVLVEPGCNMGRLSRELIKRGWTLQVMPELDELTVGGLVNGFGIETSSHKYGLFQHICTAFEIVLPSGELVYCDANNRPELFATIPWSHGTLGFMVAAELRVIRARKYVCLNYIPCQTQEEGIRVFEEASRNNDNDFVESLVFWPTKSVVMTGKLSDTVPEGVKVNAIGRWYKPWFFAHVSSFLLHGPATEAIPLRDYYHRHTKGVFWEMRDIVPFGNASWYRWLFAWIGTPKIAIMKLTTTGKLKVLWETMHVAQDLLVPMCTLKESLDLFHKELEVYPLWLCPMRMLSPAKAIEGSASLLKNYRGNKHPSQAVTTPAGSLTPPHPCDQLYVDIGAYGVPKSTRFHHETSLQRIEKFVRDVQGYQALYADTMMTRPEFRAMFDHTLYDRVRKEIGADKYMPEIYDKVNKTARA